MKTSAVCLALLSLCWACSSPGLSSQGDVSLWQSRPDPSFATLAQGLPGLTLKEEARSVSWKAALEASQGGPDLLVLEDGYEVSQAFRAGQLADPAAYLPRMTSPPRWWPALQPGAARVSPLVPSSVSVWGLFYNPSVLKAQGLTVPKDWNGLEQAFAQLKRKGITPLALGASFGWPALAWVSVLDLRFNGATAHAAFLSGKRTFDDPGLVRAVQTLGKWRDAGWFDPKASSQNWPQALAEVASGRAGFVLLGGFGQARVTDQSTLAFLALPDDPQRAGPRGDLATIQGFAVSARASHPEAAWALVDAYLLAGAPGQTAVGYRSASLSGPGESEFQKAQNELLSRDQGLFPLWDQVLDPDAASRVDRLVLQYFSAGSTLTTEDLIQALRSAGAQGGTQ